MRYVFALIITALGFASMNDSTVRNPVLLELFTSEGCSSCPPADQLLQELDREQPVANADVIVISEHVDYWNRLGWADPFSSPKFSTRQRLYADRFQLDSVYTPQLVIDGRFQVIGNDRGAVLAKIGTSTHTSKQNLKVTVSRTGDLATVAVSIPQPLPQTDLILAVARDQVRSSVHGGENHGKTLSHVAVAYFFEVLPQANPRAQVKVAADGSSRVIAFLQAKNSGQILGLGQART